MNKKFITIISCLIAIILIGGSILLIHNYNKNKAKQLYEIYGVVKKVNADSIVIEESSTNKERTILKDEASEFDEGDLVVVKFEDDKVISHQVIVDNYNEITTTTITTTTTPTTTTTTYVIGSTKLPTTTITTEQVDKDSLIINYLNDENENIKKGEKTTTFKEKAKNAFVSIVDFIFYNGTIKGVTFSELKTATKAKVIYYALLIDSGIESKFPDYKAHLGEKYNDIKAKLVAEFLEIKYFVCTKSGDDCEQVKTDFELLKKSLNLTWDFVKSAFTYIKDLSVPKIKNWYESFRG